MFRREDSGCRRKVKRAGFSMMDTIRPVRVISTEQVVNKLFEGWHYKTDENIRTNHDQSDCAAAVFSTILKTYKKEYSTIKIREIIRTDMYSTTVKGIAVAVSAVGLWAIWNKRLFY